MHYLAFLSNQADGETMQLWVPPFDANKPEAPVLVLPRKYRKPVRSA
jgi:hypothetical protein